MRHTVTNIPGAGLELGRPDPNDRDALDAWLARQAGITLAELRSARSRATERRSQRNTEAETEALRRRIIARLDGDPSPVVLARQSPADTPAEPRGNHPAPSPRPPAVDVLGDRARLYGAR